MPGNAIISVIQYVRGFTSPLLATLLANNFGKRSKSGKSTLQKCCPRLIRSHALPVLDPACAMGSTVSVVKTKPVPQQKAAVSRC